MYKSLARLFPLCVIIFFSCKSPAGRPDAIDTSARAAIDSTPSRRDALIRALTEMRGRLTSNDKNQIAKMLCLCSNRTPSSTTIPCSIPSYSRAWLKDSAFTEKLYNTLL